MPPEREGIEPRRSLELTLRVRGSDLSVSERVKPVWEPEALEGMEGEEISDGELEERVLQEVVKEAQFLIPNLVRILWAEAKAERRRRAEQLVNEERSNTVVRCMNCKHEEPVVDEQASLHCSNCGRVLRGQ